MAELLQNLIKHTTSGLRVVEEEVAKGRTFPQGVETIVQQMGEVQVLFADEDARAIFDDEQPILLVANHAFAAPLAVLAAVARRKHNDIYIFADAIFSPLMSEPIQEHLLPVQKKGKSHTRTLSPGFILSRLVRSDMPDEERRRRNQQSLEQAADIIQAKGMVILFPSGDNNDVWKQGVGRLVKDLLHKCIPFHLVAAQVRGTEQIDTFRLLGPKLSRRLLGEFTPQVTFVSMNESLHDEDTLLTLSSDDVVRRLHQQYALAFTGS